MKLSLLSLALVGLLFAGWTARGEEAKKDKEENEVKIALKDVPAVVKDAAAKAVAGIVLEDEVEQQTKDGKVVYEFDGKVGDKKYEIKVGADGKVIKTKVDDDKEEKEEKK